MYCATEIVLLTYFYLLGKNEVRSFAVRSSTWLSCLVPNAPVNLLKDSIVICDIVSLSFLSLCCIYIYEMIYNKSSAVDEMGDRVHNRHGGAAVPLSLAELGPRLTQCGLSRGLLPYQVASSSIQPFGHSRYGPKIGWGGGCALFFWEAGSPSKTK